MLVCLLLPCISAFAQPLSGTKTIGGASPTYANFTAAVSALVTNGVSGPVTFSVRNGTYEEQIEIPEITGASSTNTITFQSESGIPENVNLQYPTTASANYVVRLNGADHVRIRNMTLRSLDSPDYYYRQVVDLLGSVDDAVIHGNIIKSGTTIGGPLVGTSGYMLSTNLSITNNTLDSASAYGIYLYPSSGSTGTLIKGNTLTNIVYGMYVVSHTAPIVDSNTVSALYDGINLQTCEGAIRVERNKINVTSGSGLTLNYCNATIESPGLVANNFVTVGNSSGISLNSSSYQNIYYNSVNVTGTSSASSAFGTNGGGTDINVVNNVFLNSAGGYAYIGAGAEIVTSNYNDLYATNSQYLATWAGTNAPDLAALQAASGRDINSVSVNPHFISPTDLHTNSPWLDGAGTSLALSSTPVTTDIDGNSRHATTPDIGADEYTSSVTKLAGGTYTIGGAMRGLATYPSFTAAVGDLHLRGITGAVTFNVLNGTYNEQIELTEIAGASSTNTITFQSESGSADDVNLQFATNSSANYVLQMYGADHIRIKNMTLRSLEPEYYYRRVINLEGTSEDIVIHGNVIKSSGSSGPGELIASTSSTAILTNLVITNNMLDSTGANGVQLNGNGSFPSAGTLIKGNRLSNNSGIYLTYHTALTIDSNEVSIQSGAINLYICDGSLRVTRNKIDVASGSGISLQSCNAPSKSPGLVANNFVVAGGSSTGISVYSCNYQNIYYNSVNVTGNSTGGYAFYSSSGTEISVVNNVFANFTGGVAYRTETGTEIGASDHNDLYSSGGQYLAYWAGTNAPDLAAFQAASGKDANSISANPSFTSPTDLHTNSPWLDGAGTSLALSSTPVTTDIDGNPRHAATPDIGADEFTSSVTKLAGGTYTIGSAMRGLATYPSFTAAVGDLHLRGITGAVTFNVLNGTYNEQIELSPVAGSSSTNTVTFQSESGIASDVILQHASDGTTNYVVRLNGADHIRIKNMTLRSLESPSYYYRNVITLEGAVDDIVIHGNILKGFATYPTFGDQSLIRSGTSGISISKNLAITDNTMDSASYCVYLYGDYYARSTGTVIKGNTLTNEYGYSGIYLTYHDAAIIDSNSIAAQSNGIQLDACDGALRVERNRVVASNGINIGSSGTSENRGLIANNFVTATNTGINLNSSNYQNIYHNSVNAGGDAFYSVWGGGANHNVVNNVFVSTGGGLAYNNTYGNIEASDHNALYSTGMLANWGGTAPNLAALQTLSGQDLHSISVNPHFLSTTDLHTNSPWLDGAGTPLADVPTDIDGNPRHPSTPDIGASEYTSSITKLAGGTYTIGGAMKGLATYPSFTAAVADLNLKGITGPVTFNVQNGTYDEQIDIEQIAGTSPTNTVTFQSESGLASDVTLQYPTSYNANYVIRLNGADHVRIKNMTLRSLEPDFSYRRVIDLEGVIENNVIQGNEIRGYATEGIGTSSGIVSTNLTLTGNKIDSANTSMYLWGNSSFFPTGTLIKGNVLTNTNSGMYLQYHTAPVIDSNMIGSPNLGYGGITLYQCDGALRVERNKIGGPIALYYCYASGNSPGLIANNFVTTGNNSGLTLTASSYQNVYYNSVNVIGNYAASYSFYASSGGNNNVVNNIFMNTTGGLAYRCDTGTELDASDHNNLYSTGVLANWAGYNASDLESLQALSGKDINSISANPAFVSASDLHSNSPWLDGAGTPLAAVTTDIDGNLRHASTPDIGASEYTSSVSKLAGGTYTIGGAMKGLSTYPSFAAAVDDLNLKGITGAVTFNVQDGTYNEQIDILPVGGASPTNTVTFQSESGVASTVNLQYPTFADANHVVRINGADHVRIKNMTLRSLEPEVNYRRVINLEGHVQNAVIHGNILKGYASLSGSDAQALIGGTPNGIALTNLALTNNLMDSASYGVYLYTNNSYYDTPTGTLIKGNTISNGSGYGGIYLIYHNTPIIDSNTVIASSYGIDLNWCPGALRVERNKVGVVNGVGINLNSCSASNKSRGLIANNFASATSEGSAGSGISVYASSYHDFYHNSVNITGTDGGNALYASSVTNINMRNNIFANNAGGYAYFLTGGGSVDTTDYNDLFTSGVSLALWQGTSYADLAALIAVSQQDSHSVSIAPLFASDTDLHLTGGDDELFHCPAIGITTDIDGAVRDPISPYKGADEPDQPLPITLVSFTAQPNPNGRGVRLDWMTVSEIANFGFYVQRRSAGQPTFSEVPGSFVPGHGTTNEPHEYSFVDSTMTVPGTYSYRLRQQDFDGTSHYSWIVTIDLLTLSVTELAPREFKLFQNYPNPFNPSTEIKFSVETTGRAVMEVYNVIGQRIATLFNDVAEAGRYYKVTLNGALYSSGVYFYRLQSGKRSDIKKMMILK
jgi:polyisoprenoid-binding protein YceI